MSFRCSLSAISPLAEERGEATALRGIAAVLLRALLAHASVCDTWEHNVFRRDDRMFFNPSNKNDRQHILPGEENNDTWRES